MFIKAGSSCKKTNKKQMSNYSETSIYIYRLCRGLIFLFQFVVVGGSPRRMENFAQYMLSQLQYTLPAGQALVNIAGATDRYALYKVGPVLAVSVSTSVSLLFFRKNVNI